MTQRENRKEEVKTFTRLDLVRKTGNMGKNQKSPPTPPPTRANHLKEGRACVREPGRESVTFILLQLHLTCHCSHLLPLWQNPAHNHTHSRAHSHQSVQSDLYSGCVHPQAHACTHKRTVKKWLCCSYAKSCS